MQGLKALVIFMGVLIVVGTTALAILMVKKFNSMDEGEGEGAKIESVSPQTGARPSLDAGSFGDVSVALPAGAVVLGLQTSGNVLLVHFTSEQGEGILVFDLKEGKKQGLILLDGTAKQGN